MRGIERLTSGPRSHYFGYYDKFQDNASGTLALSMEMEFMDRAPRAEDVAGIGVIDLAHGNKLERVAETQAFCWQQACMLQWFPGEPERKIIFNVRRNDHFGCCVMDIHSGTKTFYERPIYTLAPDGTFALCPNFSRLARQRPGYGYEGIPDPWENQNAPEDDGIYRLDFATGKSRLIISLAQLAGLGEAQNYLQVPHWTNHLLIAPDNKRFAFLHRWRQPGTRDGRLHQFLTADTDGQNLRVLNDGQMTSHFIWRDPVTLLAWAGRPEQGKHYYLIQDRDTPVFEAIGAKVLIEDGHMSYQPGGKGNWFVTDTYPAPSDRCRALFLFNEKTGEHQSLGRYYADPKYDGPERCDLHPRWSRNGAAIFFDSLHEGERQTYRVFSAR
jgi:hypothetical protein